MLTVDTKITSKRQITLPVSVMKRLHLSPGDSLTFLEKDGQVSVLPRKKFTIHDFHALKRAPVKIKATDKQIDQARELAWGRTLAS